MICVNISNRINTVLYTVALLVKTDSVLGDLHCVNLTAQQNKAILTKFPDLRMVLVTYLMEHAFTFTFASRRLAYGALSVTALIGLVTLIFDLLTSK